MNATRVKQLKDYVRALLKANPRSVLTRGAWRRLKRDWVRRGR